MSEAQGLAGLKIMVAVAKADGHLAEGERKQIAEAIEELAPSLSVEEILDADVDLDTELAKITEPDVQAAIYRAAVMMAIADSDAHVEESRILQRIRETYGITDEETGVTKLLEGHALPEPMEVDPEVRDQQSKRVVVGHAIMAAALGANPLPLVSIVTEIGVYYLQGRMVRNLAFYYGHDMELKHTLALISSAFGLGLARALAVQMLKFLPVWGSVVGGATAFTTTYALGETIRRHFAQGGDLGSLTKKEARKAYEEIKKTQAKTAYEENREAIDKKAQEKAPQMEALARDLKAGKATDADIEKHLASD